MTDESNSKRLDRVEADIKELRADFREDVSKLHGKMDAILSAIAATNTEPMLRDCILKPLMVVAMSQTTNCKI